MTPVSRRDTLVMALSGLSLAYPTSQAAAQDGAVPHQAAASPPNGGDTPAWDLSDIYPDDAAWDAARRQALAAVPAMARFKGTLGNSADALAAALVAASDLQRLTSRVYTYISLKADADLRVAANQERLAQAVDLYTAVGEGTAWMTPEILAVGKPKIDAFVRQNAVLRSRFDFFLADTLRQAPHTLSPEGELLLAGTAAPMAGPGDIREQLVATDIPWPTITLSTGRQVRLDDQGYTLHRDAPVRADRKAVFDAFWGEYGRFRSSLGAAYLSHIKSDIFQKKARHYPTSLAMALSANDVPEAVYRSLVAETEAGLPQFHRYFDVRRRLLKLPDLAYYDVYPPLVQLDRRVTIPEMRATVIEALKPLGPDYAALFARATAQRWLDPLPRPGKKSGAYMNPGAAYDVHPYLLLNLGENYEGMTTYAHEWGHAMHTLLADQSQVYDKANYPTFLAEIASTCNEALLAAYMVANAKTREEKIFYLGQQLESIRGTFFRQAMLAQFELAAHDKAEAGEGLSGDAFSAMFLDLLRRYHGPGVRIDATYGVEWAYIPHFYNSFYVYQYATSIAAASYFARSILHGGASARDTYLNVLRAGGSDYPVAILRRAGLDMAGPAPYRAIIQTFKETLDQIEALMA